jgi:hypothetical protein
VGTVSSEPDHFRFALGLMQTAQGRWPGLLRRLVTRQLTLDQCALGLADEPRIKTTVNLRPD